MANGLEREKVVISVGGSLIVPQEGLGVPFLQDLNGFVREELEQNPNKQFFLVAGGGDTARRYINAGQQVLEHQITDDDKDWLGIHSTRLNAQLLRTVFRDIAHPYLIKHYDDIIRKVHEPVAIAAGWKPGWSTDYCAVQLCEDYRTNLVVNLSNIDQACDKDPNRYPDAEPITDITWPRFRQIVGDGNVWIPGANAPFDPVASRFAEDLGISVVILNGHNFDNTRACFRGEPFVGTLIHPEILILTVA